MQILHEDRGKVRGGKKGGDSIWPHEYFTALKGLHFQVLKSYGKYYEYLFGAYSGERENVTNQVKESVIRRNTSHFQIESDQLPVLDK